MSGSKKPKSQKSGKRTVAKRRAKSGGMVGGVHPYLRLLADPCGAPFAHPPYGSTDSGYLIRTVENYAIQGTGTFAAGAVAQLDFMVQVCPSAYSPVNGVPLNPVPGLSYGCIQTGQAVALTTRSPSAFVCTSAAPKRYRPVASCAKFIPFGPYSTRQGVIGLSYLNGMSVNPGSGTFTASTMLAECLEVAPCGAEKHEIRWLPTMEDQSWRDVVVYDGSSAGGGTLLIVGNSVDGTYLGPSTAAVNGYIEITTVWEWTPAVAQGLAVQPTPPSPYTIQQLLSTIGNISDFVLGVATRPSVQRAVTYGVQMASRAGMATPRIPLLTM